MTLLPWFTFFPKHDFCMTCVVRRCDVS